jgi:hypothetical protein
MEDGVVQLIRHGVSGEDLATERQPRDLTKNPGASLIYSYLDLVYVKT